MLPIAGCSPAPNQGERVESFAPSIDIEYDHEGSGVSVVTFRAMVNDRDYSADFEHHSRGATAKIAPSRQLPLGENRIVITVADRTGNVGRAESTFINAGGGWLSVVADPGAGPKRHIDLVLDASGSMNDAMLDNTRIAVAKGAVKGLLKILPDETPLGLRVFKGCDDIKALLPIAKVDRAAFAATVDKIQPPMAGHRSSRRSCSRSRRSRSSPRPNGRGAGNRRGESCNGSLADAAEQAKELSIRLIVITFDPEEETVNDKLRQMAETTGGAYFNAQDGAELRAALERSILRLSYSVYDREGAMVAAGDGGGDRLMLPIGKYQIRLDVSPKLSHDVEITPLAEVKVRLRQAVRVSPSRSLASEGGCSHEAVVRRAHCRIGLAVVGSVVLSANEPCCSIVKFDQKTRIVTIREIATNREYTCQAKDAKELQDVKIGQQLILNVANLQRVGAAGQAASSGSTTKACPSGWNGPRGADTRPTAPPSKPK